MKRIAHTRSFSKTELTARLGLKLPVIQGPFGGGLSTPHLAAAVSEKGGLGSFGAHHLGPDEIVSVAAAIRARTDKPFGLNLWVSNSDPEALSIKDEDFDHYARTFEPLFQELGLPVPARPVRFGYQFEEQIDALLDAAPPVFSFVFGIPSRSILTACRARGIFTIGAATTVAEAQALEAAGVDAIVASGFEAGGHRPSFLKSAEDSLFGTLSLTQLVVRAVHVPVVAAGGLANRRSIDAALTLGAQAAQLGTAFLACAESGASELHRERLFSAAEHATVLTRAFSGRLARGLGNDWTAAHAHGTRRAAPYPVQGWFLAQLREKALIAGRTDLLTLWCGQAAPLLRHRTVDALIDDLLTVESDITHDTERFAP